MLIVICKFLVSFGQVNYIYEKYTGKWTIIPWFVQRVFHNLQHREGQHSEEVTYKEKKSIILTILFLKCKVTNHQSYIIHEK